MLKKQKLTIRNKLVIAFGAILIIPVLMTGQFSYRTAERKVSEQFMNNAYESVRLMDKLLTTTLESSMNNVTQLAEQIDFSMDEPQIRKYLDPFQNSHPEISSTYLGTEAGATFISPYVEVGADYDPRVRPWYMGAMDQKGQVYITEPYIQVDENNKSTGNVIVSVVRAVKDGSGVVGVDLNLGSIGEDIKKVHIGKEGNLAVFDKNGKVLVHPTLETGTEIKESWISQIVGQDSDQFDYSDNGEMKMVYFVTNPLTGWKIIGTMNREEIAREAAPIYYATFVVIVISILLGGVLIFLVVRSITKPLMKLVSAAKSIGEGDLTVEVETQSKDEVGVLAVTFNGMCDMIRQILLQLRDKIDRLAASSEELTAGSEQAAATSSSISETSHVVADGASRQAASVEESSKSINEITDNLKLILANAQSASSISSEASGKAQGGNEIIQKAVKQMDSIYQTVNGLSQGIGSLGERSKEIEQIIGVITTIADQTNLLALNAAIEAARAGEHGRGFAVVSGEVGKLAEQSVTATKQISALIAAIQTETQKVVQIMEKTIKEVFEGITVMTSAGEAFNQIEDAICGVSGQIDQVTSSIHEISERTQKVAGSIDSIRKISEESASGIQQVFAATEEQLASFEEIHSAAALLTDIAVDLQALSEKFKL
ncbi:MAG TPA: methyl-accepting chemotaxis protein [Clostridia bacterium]|nr:methyl-accepting chemotaxis protein [Clostridia bacterium]